MMAGVDVCSGEPVPEQHQQHPNTPQQGAPIRLGIDEYVYTAATEDLLITELELGLFFKL